ncbi:MAG TPA: translation elongation factor Ts [Gemmatimonadales bacterium]|nr:translation elongation factor Ts [Gemmatimonadales bacterium]
MTTKAVSTKDISELRARTSAGMMDCKVALEEAGGDLDKAAEILRKKGIAKAEKRGGRVAAQGLVVIASHGAGDMTMIELDCETDFVVRTEEFGNLARELAAHAARQAPTGVHPGSALDSQPFAGRTVAEAIKELAAKTGEATTLRRVARLAQPNGTVQSYLHHNGQVGVLVELEGPGGDALVELGRELALHIASADPIGVSETDIPGEVLERERRIAEEQVAAGGKPEAIRPKIVAGKLRKFVGERTLLGQPFVKDETRTAGDLVKTAAQTLGGPVTVRRFARFKVGEA